MILLNYHIPLSNHILNENDGNYQIHVFAYHYLLNYHITFLNRLEVQKNQIVLNRVIFSTPTYNRVKILAPLRQIV